MRRPRVAARLAALLVPHAALVLLSAGAVLAAGVVRAQERPNVVLVMADDLGRGELGAYGQELLSTPAIDALSRRSARFTQAYATAPVCAPSRCSVLTGLQMGHCAVTENYEPNQPLPSRDPTIAELLASVGYRGAMVGKWALGGELDDGTPWNVQSAPWRVGFEDVLAVLDQEQAQDHYPGWLWRAAGGEGALEGLAGNADGGRLDYAPDLFAAHALELVRTAPEPFFLYFSATLPHRELVAPPGAQLASGDELPPEDAVYRAMVERLDAQLGALVEALRARGVEERTVVVFTSDNGPNAVDGHAIETFRSSGALRGRKRDLYEGGIRVPLLVVGPGIEARTIDSPVSLADLLPTLTALGSAPTPPAIDGRSLVPLLTSRESVEDPHDSLYFACRERRGGAEPATRDAVRRGRWKWIRRADGGEELYDLEVDPGETTDLSEREPEVVLALRAAADAALVPRARAVAPLLSLSVRRHDASQPTSPSSPEPSQPEPARSAPEPDPSAPEPAPSELATPVLALAAGDIEADDTSWPQRLEVPALVATIVGAVPVREGESAFVRLTRSASAHVVVPAHPALAIGGWSFSLHARLRLTSLASGPERDERQWLVFAKPTGLHDVHASFGVLAQGGDLSCDPREPSGARTCTGREIAVFFGDPRFEEARPFAVAGSLSIEDDELHDLFVRVDRDRGLVELTLDGQREVIPFLISEGIGAETPLVIGGHHDARGRFSQGLDAELHALALAEGLASDEALLALEESTPGRVVRVDVGDAALGTELDVALELQSAPRPQAHWLEASVALDPGAPGELEGGTRAILFAGDRRVAHLRLDTSRLGPVEADLVVHATRGRSGALVHGAPIRVHVTGRVVAASAEVVPRTGGGLARGLCLALFVVTLVVAALASRRRARQ